MALVFAAAATQYLIIIIVIIIMMRAPSSLPLNRALSSPCACLSRCASPALHCTAAVVVAVALGTRRALLQTLTGNNNNSNTFAPTCAGTHHKSVAEAEAGGGEYGISARAEERERKKDERGNKVK